MVAKTFPLPRCRSRLGYFTSCSLSLSNCPGMLGSSLPPAREADTVESPTAKRVEIRVRELDPALAAQVSYVRQVAPIFANNCADCHSLEEHKGELDASSVPSLMKGGKKAGPAIVPGKPDESPLMQFL